MSIKALSNIECQVTVKSGVFFKYNFYRSGVFNIRKYKKDSPQSDPLK
jgi:hypothetical protein